MPSKAWRELKRRQIADCRVFQVEAQLMAPPKRDQASEAVEFYVLNCPDWINVVAYTESGALILIEEWRQGTQSLSLELPAGVVDPGETAFEAAKRELLEETGYTAPRWFELGWVHPNAALQGNRCTTFLAEDARRVADPKLDPTEAIDLRLTSYAEASRWLAEGQITHAMAVVALGFEAQRRCGERRVRAL